jgi:hypothetical protein
MSICVLPNRSETSHGSTSEMKTDTFTSDSESAVIQRFQTSVGV